MRAARIFFTDVKSLFPSSLELIVSCPAVQSGGDMGQLYGAALLPFGAICVLLLLLRESGASSMRSTLAVDTSR